MGLLGVRMSALTFGGFTFGQLYDMVDESREKQIPIDDLGGGDGAISCNIIADLLAHIAVSSSTKMPISSAISR